MFNSKKYWNDRYVTGGNSGSGSYNELAKLTANLVSSDVKSIVDKSAEKAILDYRNKEVNRDRNALFVFNDLELQLVKRPGDKDPDGELSALSGDGVNENQRNSFKRFENLLRFRKTAMARATGRPRRH